MSRTGLDAATLARSLRDRAGDGSIDWVSQPIQADVLLDIADMLDENAKLRELMRVMAYCMQHGRECDGCRLNGADGTITAPVGCDGLLDRMRELGVIE
jgi:hypothetical protein